MTFFEYLKNPLKFPLSGYVFDGFWKAICKSFDNLKEDVYHLRKQFIPYISDYLIKFADERGIYRFRYETEEQFKTRILYAFAFVQKVLNQAELENYLKMLTKKPFLIRQTNKWRLGMSKLGQNTYLNVENRCSIEFFEKLSIEEREYLYSVLRFYLPAHVEIFLIEPQDEVIRWRLGYSLLGKNTILKED